jgi:hypothetical protein
LYHTTGGDIGVLQVRVKLLNGEEIQVPFAADDTVANLKSNVAAQTGIIVTDFKFKFDNLHCMLTTRLVDLRHGLIIMFKTVKFAACNRSLLRIKNGEISVSRLHAEYVCTNLANVVSDVAKTEKKTTEILALLQNPGTAVGDENWENMTDADLQNIRSVADLSRVNTIARMQKAKAEQDRRKTLQKEDAAKARLANLSAATIAQLDAAGGVVKKAKELAVAEADKKKEEAKIAKREAQEAKKREAEDHTKKTYIAGEY